MPILNWLTRDEDIRTAQHVPYRLLEEVPDLSAGDGGAGNMLIQGDNLEALKALLPFYAGRVKCIYIDPPYNTRSAFEHYDDNLEHTQWLAMMWPRLELLRDLLAEDGSIWVSIDDNEGHYLKVIMDEVFGRRNFIANTLWQKVFSPKNTARHFSADHDHILVFARNADKWVPNPMPRSDRMNKGYKNPDNDPRGLWTSGDVSARNFYGAGRYAITCPAAVAHKMNRRYIGIEMGEHAHTHCAPRLQKVIDGEQGGISESAGWKGGGGFRFYRLGPPVFDEEGHIRQDIRFPVLAAHVWFSETDRPWDRNGDSPLLWKALPESD